MCLSSRFEIFVRSAFFKNPSLFRSAPKRPTCENCNTLHTKTCFSKVHSRATAASKTTTPEQKTTTNVVEQIVECKGFLQIFGVPQGPAAKMPRNGSPEPLREPPGPSRASPGRPKSINFSGQVATRRHPMNFSYPNIEHFVGQVSWSCWSRLVSSSGSSRGAASNSRGPPGAS